MIEDLIAGETADTGDVPRLFKVRLIEVTDAPGKYLTLLLQLLKSPDCLFERVRAPPVQEITVEPAGLQASQRSVTGRYRAPPRGILGKNFGDKKNLVPTAGNRFGNHFLCGARSIQLRCIDVV